MIRRMLNDPKIAKITLAPLGMIFLVYSIFLIFQHPELGIGGIILFLGIYFLFKAYGWDKSLEEYLSTVKQSLVEGRFSFILYVTSAILLIIGLIQGFNYSMTESPSPQSISAFIYGSIWWFVLSGIFTSFAKAIDVYVEGRSVRRYVSISFLFIAFGLVIWGSSAYLMAEMSRESLTNLAVSVVAAIIVAIIGVVPLKVRT
jgi:putative membrane protein